MTAHLLKENLTIIIIFLLYLFSSSIINCNEIDLDKTEELFTKMFCDDFNKVISTATKANDKKFSLKLILFNNI